MRYYTEGRIAEERRRRRIEEEEHGRLCNAGINQRWKVYESDEERAEFERQYHEFMLGGYKKMYKETRERSLANERKTTT